MILKALLANIEIKTILQSISVCLGYSSFQLSVVKTNTKVITLANHKGCNNPMIQSKLDVGGAKFRKTCTSQDAIDLMYNDVKQCFCGSNMHCGSCSHVRIQCGVVFLLNMSVILTCVQMWLDHREAARAICLSFQIGQLVHTFPISPTPSVYWRPSWI